MSTAIEGSDGSSPELRGLLVMKDQQVRDPVNSLEQVLLCFH